MFFHFTFEKLQLPQTLPFVRKKGARYFHEDAFSERIFFNNKSWKKFSDGNR